MAQYNIFKAHFYMFQILSMQYKIFDIKAYVSGMSLSFGSETAIFIYGRKPKITASNPLNRWS